VRSKQGFTLIELVVVLGLISIVISIIFSPIMFSVKNFGIQKEKSVIISNTRTTLDYLTKEIRRADKIEVEDNILNIDLKTYKLENRTLFKDDIKIIEGIDGLNIKKENEKITIEIIINDSKGIEHKFSTVINLR